MQDFDFRTAFAALPSPYMIVDADLRYVAANAAYERATMRTFSELAGRNLFELFPNDEVSGQRLRASFQRVLETGEQDTLAFIPYDIPRPAEQGGGLQKRYWTAVHTPLRDHSGKVAYVMQNTVDVTDMVRLQAAAMLPFRTMPGATDLLQRAREAEEAKQRLLSEGEDFRRLFQNAPGFFAILSGPSHIFTFANDAYVRLIGGRNVIGMRLDEALPEIVGQGFIEMLDEVFGQGVVRGGEGQRVMLVPHGGGDPVERFLDFNYHPIFDAQGAINGVFVQGMDRTEQVRSQNRQRILLDELNHRVKNTLATVQSIANQTMRTDTDRKTAVTSFHARLKALSLTHNLLSRSGWEGADLQELVRQELEPHGLERVVIDGPSLHLEPRVVLALGMVLHELATNAATHGALQTCDGRVHVAWAIVPEASEPRLRFQWREEGSAPVSEPSRTGFGSRLLRYSISGELAGNVDLRYASSGLECDFTIPLPEKAPTNVH